MPEPGVSRMHEDVVFLIPAKQLGLGQAMCRPSMLGYSSTADERIPIQ